MIGGEIWPYWMFKRKSMLLFINARSSGVRPIQ